MGKEKAGGFREVYVCKGKVEGKEVLNCSLECNLVKS